MSINPILRITDGTEIVDLLGNNSGWELSDPYWNPQIAQYKGGGSYVNSGLAEGQRLVHKEYDNVIETIPLSVRGVNQDRTIRTIRKLLQLGKQASDYWTKSYEYDDVWIEARPACNKCLTGYARIIKMSIPELTNPFGQPFFSSFNDAIMNGIMLTIEREPLWRAIPPGQLIGPLYNLLKNPDFELWNSGTADSQPDSWTDLETLQITGDNNRETIAPNSGQYSLKIHVGGSTATGKAKGISQIIENVEGNTQYTIVAWVRSEGVSNGVGRILVTYSSQLELYRSSTRHGWTLYANTFTTGTNDVVSVNLEILTTAANTDGAFYIDSLMLIKGDWTEEATNGTLPYMSGSHIVNHFDNGAGDINYVDVWNIPGDEDALIRLEMINNTTPADSTNIVEDMAVIRIGQRRTGNVFELEEYHDPAGVPDATCSDSDRVQNTPTASWVDVSTHNIVGVATVADNVGRYRAFARIYDAKASGDPTLQARLRYWKGISSSAITTLDYANIPQRAAWNMVDLTPNRAVIWDAKFSTNFPGGLGCTVQFNRPAGTGNAYLDYLLLLPTDGGIFTGIVNPGISPGGALVIDNTASGIVGAVGVKNGYILRVATTGNLGGAVCEFNGVVYATVVDLAVQTLLYKYYAGEWTYVQTFAGEVFTRQMAVYNGQLYMAREDGINSYLYSSPDGLNWTLKDTKPLGTITLLSFEGYLWWSVNDGNSLYKWDGSTSTLEATSASVIGIGVYGGKLYYTDDLGLYVRSGGVWGFAIGAGLISLGKNLEELNGKLLILNGTNVTIYDGSTLTDVAGPTLSNTDIMVMDNIAYVSSSGVIYSSTDGVNWTIAYDESILDTVTQMLGHEGAIHFATTGGVIVPTAALYSIIPSEPVEYSVADYQLGGGSNGGFVSPSRKLPANQKRHRWIFSFDRSNGSNVITDKALVGIGFVPRYLTLRGAD